MNYSEFKEKLTSVSMFTDAEVHKITRTVGKYTLGNAISACFMVGIELYGSDIDELIAHFQED